MGLAPWKCSSDLEPEVVGLWFGCIRRWIYGHAASFPAVWAIHAVTSLVRGVIPGLEWMHLTVLPVILPGT